MLISLPFIERRFRNGATGSGYGRERNLPPFTRERRASVARDKSQRVIYEIGCFNKPPDGATKHRASARAAFRNGAVIFIREIYYLQFELNEF